MKHPIVGVSSFLYEAYLIKFQFTYQSLPSPNPLAPGGGSINI